MVDSFVWHIHPQNSTEWILKRYTPQEEEQLVKDIEDDKLNFGVTSLSLLSDGENFEFTKFGIIKNGDLYFKIDVPSELYPSVQFVYDFENKNNMDVFKIDSAMFQKKGYDDAKSKFESEYIDKLYTAMENGVSNEIVDTHDDSMWFDMGDDDILDEDGNVLL